MDCNTEKVDIPGYLVDADSFADIVARLCALEQAPPVVVPDQEVCTGPFQQQSGITGWWATWTAIRTANFNDASSPWYNIGVTRTAPDCPTDLNVNIDLGNHYFLLRRIRSYLWIDVRLLINGAQVDIESNDKYLYLDQRSDTNPDVINPVRFELYPMGVSNLYRANVPAGATMQIQARTRLQGVGAQPSAYHRYIGGLRSEATFHNTPRELITGRI